MMADEFTNFEDDEDGAPPVADRPPQPRRGRSKEGREVRLMTPIHDPGHRNPPLTALNASYRKAEEAERRERSSVVEKATDAIRGAFGSAPRRTQKALRPIP